MNRPDLFDETIQTLVSAYLKGDLIPTRSCGCAVGTLIKAAHSLPANTHAGQTLYQEPNGDNPVRLADWIDLFATFQHSNNEWIQEAHYLVELSNKMLLPWENAVLGMIEQTGYEPLEIACIEYAFERAAGLARGSKFGDPKPTLDQLRASAYDGLLAVVDELMQIHGCASSVRPAIVSSIPQAHAASVCPA